MPKKKKKKKKNKASRSDWEARRLDLDALRPLATAVPVARIREGNDAARLETQTSSAQTVEAAALLQGSGVQVSDAAAAAAAPRRAAVSCWTCSTNRLRGRIYCTCTRARTVKITHSNLPSALSRACSAHFLLTCRAPRGSAAFFAFFQMGKVASSGCDRLLRRETLLSCGKCTVAQK